MNNEDFMVSVKEIQRIDGCWVMASEKYLSFSRTFFEMIGATITSANDRNYMFNQFPDQPRV